MQDEFNTELDDNSQTEIGTLLCKCYNLFTSNKTEELNQLIGPAPVAAVTQSEKQQSVKCCDDLSTDSEDDVDMDTSSSMVVKTFGDCRIAETSSIPELDENGAEMKEPEISENVEDDGWTAVTKRTKNKSRKS